MWAWRSAILHLLSLRPFSRTHIGFIGDCINVAARLMSHAIVDEIIVSNAFYQRLSEAARADFRGRNPSRRRMSDGSKRGRRRWAETANALNRTSNR